MTVLCIISSSLMEVYAYQVMWKYAHWNLRTKLLFIFYEVKLPGELSSYFPNNNYNLQSPVRLNIRTNNGTLRATYIQSSGELICSPFCKSTVVLHLSGQGTNPASSTSLIPTEATHSNILFLYEKCSTLKKRLFYSYFSWASQSHPHISVQ